MKTLIITEKPSVARDIAAVLGKFNKKDGYLENDKFVVSWAIGHLVELAEPEDYNPGLKKWSLQTLPFIPDIFLFKASPKTTSQYAILKSLLLSPEVSLVINACDAGREGENIFRRIYALAGCAKEFKRLWLRETTPAAISMAFENLRPHHELDNLALAAAARAQADWLVGINATRAFTCRHREILSVGRVQTPTLALIVRREEEIRNFQMAKYWEIWATFQKKNGEKYLGKWFSGEEEKLPASEAAKAILEAVLSHRDATVVLVEEKEVKEPPPLLFNLNDLQKEANQKFGLTAKQTLQTAQELYEKHKLISYPRTDSRHLSTLLAATIGRRLSALKAISAYLPLIPEQLPQLTKRYIDDAKVSDHHAIIITEVQPQLGRLPKNGQLIYNLIARRLLCIFYPVARYKATRVITGAGTENFLSRGKVELDQGWKKVYAFQEKKGEEEQTLPPLSKDEQVHMEEAQILEKQTKPPHRYTEATLLTAMEKAGRFVEDREMQTILKAAGGIGTPSTRAAVIERLLGVGYIERKKKTLFPTAKGEALINMVPEEVKSPELTARWEQGLLEIEAGQAAPDNWLDAIKQFTGEIVSAAKNQESKSSGETGKESLHRSDSNILGKCPRCARDVVEFPKSYSCTGWREGCRFTIWKKIAGKNISPTQAKTLLQKSKTGLLKGFQSRSGKKFNAILTLKNGQVVFDFNQSTN